MCKYNHELCQHDLTVYGDDKHKVNLHYFEKVRNATKEEHEEHRFNCRSVGVYKCKICGELHFFKNQDFKTQLKICKNSCNGVKRGRSVNVIVGYNNIGIIAPKYVEYFINKEDAINTVGSQYKVQLKCPRCGKIKTDKIMIGTLIKNGFSCEFCGDGISYPEKIMALILETLGIKYERQCKFDDYNCKYDFHLINSDTIIEVHGGQHYKDGRGYMKTYEKEHENDLYKYDLAVLNCYEYNKNYFVIDARHSNIEHMRNSIRQCKFFKQFNLDNIDWQEIDVQAQDSLKIEICEYWKQYKEKNPSLTIFEFINILELKIGLTTIRSYLNWGNENGFCEYNGEEERLQAFHSRVDTFVYLIRPNGEKWFEEPMSQSELCRKTGIFHTTLGSSRRNNKPLRYSNSAKYDPKYIGSYVVLADEYDAQNN